MAIISESFPSINELAEQTEFMAPYITEQRRTRIESVLEHRTRKLTVVLEDLYQSHNASACLRSCECFGVQDVHIIEAKNSYRLNQEISMGSDKWLTLKRYQSKDAATECLKELRSQGRKIAVTALGESSRPLSELSLETPTALVFGTEETGVSSFWIEHADELVKMPLWGFTQSFNISVSLAVALSQTIPRLKELDAWQLTPQEKASLRLEWYIKSSVSGEKIFNSKFNKHSKC